LKGFIYSALRWEWFYDTKRQDSMVKSTSDDRYKDFVSIDKSVGLFPVIVFENPLTSLALLYLLHLITMFRRTTSEKGFRTTTWLRIFGCLVCKIVLK
jgi:hypothetical protein